MSAALLPALVAISLLAGPSAAPPDRLEARLAMAFDTPLRAWIEAGELPGAVALVARHGEIRLLRAWGYRDLERRAPMTVDTIVRIYSMTKPITSAAVLQLFEAGGLEPSDPVERFVEGFGSAGILAPDGSTLPLPAPARLQHLLTHTSGLPWNPPDDGDVSGAPEAERAILRLYHRAELRDPASTLAESLRKLESLPLRYAPGTDFRYGMATDLLGRVLEVETGRPLDEVLRRQLFSRLGMVDTGFSVEASHASRLATVYFSRAGGLEPQEPVKGGSVLAGQRRYLSGAGGLVSTARDFWRFAQMLLDGGLGPEGRVLSTESVAAMTRDQLPAAVSAAAPLGPGRGFGYGLWVVTDADLDPGPYCEGSFGWAGGANTFFFVDPREQLVAILMTQLRPFRHLPLEDLMASAVYQSLEHRACEP